MNNRLSIQPLVEENMNQMTDGEFSVSQTTGHITLKKEDEYISKTKEKQAYLINENIRYKDIEQKFQEDTTAINNLRTKLNTLNNNKTNIINKFNELKTGIDNFKSDLYTFDNNIKNKDIEMVKAVNDVKTSYYNLYDSSIEFLAQANIAKNLAKRAYSANNYFECYVKNIYKNVKENNLSSIDTQEVVSYDLAGRLDKIVEKLNTYINVEEAKLPLSYLENIYNRIQSGIVWHSALDDEIRVSINVSPNTRGTLLATMPLFGYDPAGRNLQAGTRTHEIVTAFRSYDQALVSCYSGYNTSNYGRLASITKYDGTTEGSGRARWDTTYIPHGPTNPEFISVGSAFDDDDGIV